jgi:hypothetical protein
MLKGLRAAAGRAAARSPRRRQRVRPLTRPQSQFGPIVGWPGSRGTDLVTCCCLTSGRMPPDCSRMCVSLWSSRFRRLDSNQDYQDQNLRGCQLPYAGLFRASPVVRRTPTQDTDPRPRRPLRTQAGHLDPEPVRSRAGQIPSRQNPEPAEPRAGQIWLRVG